MQLSQVSKDSKMFIVAVATIFASVASPMTSEAKGKNLLGSAGGLGKIVMQSNVQTDNGAIVDRWAKAAQTLEDYTFNFQMEVFKDNGDKIVDKGTLWFKKPRLLRIEETGGPKSGSVAVLTKDGTVKAHMGGAMKFLTVSLSPDSNYLKSANGWPMVKSDFISLADAVKGYIKDGCVSKTSDGPVNIEGIGKVYDWSLYKPNGVIYKRALFDPDNMQPVQWWDYVDGKVYAHSVWTGFRSNIGLSDKTFTIKGDK